MQAVQKSIRPYLMLMALVYGAFGLWSLVDPLGLANSFGYSLTLPSGLNEFRAAYGGQFVMLALFLYLGAGRLEWQRPCLLLLGLDMGGFASGRLLSMLSEGLPASLHLGAFVGECLICGLSLMLFSKSSSI